MKIVLTVNPIENIFSECAVCFLPRDMRPLQGAVGRVDWALNGMISRLAMGGKVSGDYLESVLIRPERFLATEKLLILGMGPRGECAEEKVKRLGERFIHILAGLHVKDVSLSFNPPPEGQSVDTFAELFTGGFLAENGDKELEAYREEMNLAISCTPEEIDETLLGIQKAKVRLKKHFSVIVLE